MMEPPSQITKLLQRLSSGDADAEAALIPLVYRELHHIAGALMRAERREHTLQPTALVHEAYVRLVEQKSQVWENRVHFFAVAARIMRRILVDHARQRQAQKRGGPTIWMVSECEEARIPGLNNKSEPMLDLDEALNRLSTVGPRQARVVEMRFFGGMTEEEIGQVLGISSRTVKRDWTIAKAWL